MILSTYYKLVEIIKEKIINAPVDSVFNAVAEGELFKATGVLEESFKIDFCEGGEYFFKWPEAGSCRGRFTKIVQHKEVVFSWVKSHAVYSEDNLTTQVKITLDSNKDGTVFILHHLGFDLKEAYDSHNSGWDDVLIVFSQNILK